MATKKRGGLGRGIGALIPQTSEGERPVDVFFPNRTAAQVADEAAASDSGEGIATPATDESTEGGELREVGTVGVAGAAPRRAQPHDRPVGRRLGRVRPQQKIRHGRIIPRPIR